MQGAVLLSCRFSNNLKNKLRGVGGGCRNSADCPFEMGGGGGGNKVHV